MTRLASVLLLSLTLGSASHAGQAPADSARDGLHRPLDTLLDLYVRDGLVYYRALKAQRAGLDGYVKGLASASIDAESREEKIAFWLNAYNALVLQTVVNQYPIAQRTREYPAGSIRQISGAFERLTHRVAGQTLTLDQIEQTILPAFQDPRLYLALGRGAVGSEAYTAANVERQLTEIANECVNRAQCAEVDRVANTVKLNSVFSWREKEFVAAYADKAAAVFAARSPIERAALAFIDPRLVTTEREFLEKNEFKVEFLPFDWTLNDLTGRAGR